MRSHFVLNVHYRYNKERIKAYDEDTIDIHTQIPISVLVWYKTKVLKADLMQI